MWRTQNTQTIGLRWFGHAVFASHSSAVAGVLFLNGKKNGNRQAQQTVSLKKKKKIQEALTRNCPQAKTGTRKFLVDSILVNNSRLSAASSTPSLAASSSVWGLTNVLEQKSCPEQSHSAISRRSHSTYQHCYRFAFCITSQQFYIKVLIFLLV